MSLPPLKIESLRRWRSYMFVAYVSVMSFFQSQPIACDQMWGLKCRFQTPHVSWKISKTYPRVCFQSQPSSSLYREGDVSEVLQVLSPQVKAMIPCWFFPQVLALGLGPCFPAPGEFLLAYGNYLKICFLLFTAVVTSASSFKLTSLQKLTATYFCNWWLL